MTHGGGSGTFSRRSVWWGILLCALVTLVVYSVSFRNGFVWDDEDIIVQNSQTRGLSHLPEVLFSPDVVKPYYRPLNRASYLVDYWSYGMNPAGFHAVNILIHTLNACLLYLVARRLLTGRMAPLLVALLFAVHPASCEAVNFISARNTLLSLTFALGSFIFFLRAQERSSRWPIASGLLFFCGLASKETALMVLPVLAVYTQYPLSESRHRPWRDKALFLAPYLVFLVIYLGMRSYSLQGVLGVAVPTQGLWARLAQNYYIIPRYLGLLLFPAGLTVLHRLPHDLFGNPWLVAAWCAIGCTAWLLWKSRDRTARFALLWLALNYLPISNLVPIPSDAMTERFLYVPAVGFFLICGVVVARAEAHPRVRRAAVLAACALLIAFSMVAVRRNLEWHDDLALFSSAVRNDPQSVAAHYNLGTALRESGDLAGAEREWARVLVLDPAHGDALTQLGTAAASRGDFQRARDYYNAAVRNAGTMAASNLALTHYNLARVYEKLRMPREALWQYEESLKGLSNDYLSYRNDAEQRRAALRGALR